MREIEVPLHFGSFPEHPENFDVVRVADLLLSRLFTNAPAKLEAEAETPGPVTWRIKVRATGEIIEVYTISNTGLFRSVLALIGHCYMNDQLYGGHEYLIFKHNGNLFLCRLFMSNGNGSGCWIRAYASPMR